ncbi:unnamed protein product [Rhizoctonia solani]|nr:unnamed protein product [Rhizoctonia solani]
MSAFVDFSSHLLDALPSPVNSDAVPQVQRRWQPRRESFADYLQWIYSTNYSKLPPMLKQKFESTIADTRSHEITILTFEGNNQEPEPLFVLRGYQNAFRPLVHFLRNEIRENTALDGKFNTRVALEMIRRVDLARSPGMGHTHCSTRQKRNKH